MMRIIDMVHAKMDEIDNDPTHTAGAVNQEKAIAAVLGGIQSAAWQTYMEQFIDPNNEQLASDQLMRLLATDGTSGDRAYLVGNGVCGETTVTTLDREVNSIDAGIGDGCLT